MNSIRCRLAAIAMRYGALWSVAVFLLPTLFFGYTADDRQWVLSRQFAHDSQMPSVFDAIANALRSTPRFFPINTILYTGAFRVFDYHNAWIYHLVIICLNVAAFAVFLQWKGRISGTPHDWGIVAVVLTVTQFRLTYNDPIVSNAGMLQILAILFFGGLIALDRYLAEGRTRELAVWSIITSLQLMTYELGFFMLSVTAYVIFRQRSIRKRQCQVAAVTGMILVVVYISVYLAISKPTLGSYSGTTMHIRPGAVVSTFIVQTFGSLPGSYAAYLAAEWKGIPPLIGWSLYVVVAVVGLTLLLMPFSSLKERVSGRRDVLITGVLIWVSAAGSIALSARYQDELTPGLAYAVVYMQNFGFALVAAVFINFNGLVARAIVGSLLVVNFIVNGLVLKEGRKIDGAKVITAELVSNHTITGTYRFDVFLLNEKVFYSLPQHSIIAGPHLGRPVAMPLKEIVQRTEWPSDSVVGIVVAEVERYAKTYAIIGRLNVKLRRLEEGTLVSPSSARAAELATLYSSGPVQRYGRLDEPAFGFRLSHSIQLPSGLIGHFR